MKQRLRALAARWFIWLLWLLLSAIGAAWIARADLAQRQDSFDTDARIAHRLLSQQVVQYDAVLATLALLGTSGDAQKPEQRLSAVYPSILDVQRRDRDGTWPDAALAEAESLSRAQHRPALAQVDLPRGRYRLVVGADPVSYALNIDLAAAVPWRDWPMDPRSSPVRVTIEREGQRFVVQPGLSEDFDRNANASPLAGWRFDFRKVLASDSQSFDVVAQRRVGWNELPWGWMTVWSVAVGAALAGLQFLQRQRTARRRAEDLLRLGQVARLNALGELAAGMAHELNQPLTALLANTQAAVRLLDDEPPDLSTARGAMQQAALQARRAADVVGRLRRVIERPDAQGRREPVSLQAAVQSALHLLEPECARRQVTIAFDADVSPVVRVLADPVALEQIVHNLLVNALQALDEVPASGRRIAIETGIEGAMGRLTIADSGTGIAPDALPRVFEPFFSTRSAGLGLGLSLCETLAGNMGGSLTASTASQAVVGSASSTASIASGVTLPGARFTLALPLA